MAFDIAYGGGEGQFLRLHAAPAGEVHGTAAGTVRVALLDLMAA